MTTIKIKKTEFQKLYKLACSTWKPKFDEKFKNFLFEDYIEFEYSFLQQMQDACTPEQLKVLKTIFKCYLQESENLFKITTYKAVCKKLNEKEETCPYKKIKQIEKLFNGSWIKDWKNKNQSKYYPYFEITGSGLVSFGSLYVGYCLHGQVAYFKDNQTSIFVGKTFIDIYEELM